jgi:hypothetical protein
MTYNVSKEELEQALNNLPISDKSKESLASSLESRKEPLLINYAIQVLGVLFLLAFIVSIYLYVRIQGFSLLKDPMLYAGLFCLLYGNARIRAIKLQRAMVELIMVGHHE